MQINIYKKVETRAHARRDFIFPFVPNVLFDEMYSKKLTQRGTNQVQVQVELYCHSTTCVDI